jgi:multiple sugar transport system substrate-binding protein
MMQLRRRVPVSRRRFLSTLIGSAAATALASCAPPAPPTAAPTKPAAAPAAAPPPTTAPAPTTPPQPTTAAQPTAAAANPTAAPKPTTAPAATTVAASKAPVTLSYWFTSDSPKETQMYQDFFALFQKNNPNIAIQPNMEKAWGDLRTKLLTTGAAGAGLPDTVRSGFPVEFGQAGLLLKLDDRFKSWKFAEDMFPEIVEQARVVKGAPLYAVPEGANAFYIYYRPDWAKEKNLKIPDTFEEEMQFSKALHDPPNRFGYDFRGGDFNGLHTQLGMYWKGNGVEIIKDDGTIDIDSPEAVSTLEWWLSFYTKEKITQPSALSDRFPELFAAYQGGKLATLHHHLGSWRTQYDAMGEKASAMLWPKGKVRRWINGGADGAGQSVGATTKNPDEAFQLIAFLVEPTQAKMRADIRGSLAIFKSIKDDPLFTSNVFMKTAQQSLQYLGAMPTWHPAFGVLTDRFAAELQRAMKQEITAEQALRGLATEMRKVKWEKK